MDYRPLGRSGLKVSPLCLGTMMFGGRTDADDSRRIVDLAKDGGVNFIDTADVYNKGASEAIVGRAIADDRDHWVLATKVANKMGPGVMRGGLSRRWLIQACHDSLRRLGTDWIDVYYLHKEDHATPLEETIAAIGTLIAHGHIRYFGLSNHRAWRIAEVVRLCEAMNVPRPIVLQPYYNLMNRMPEVEVLPACAHYGLGVAPYSPIARGVLSGKYRLDADAPADSRLASGDKRILESEWRPESLKVAATLQEHAEATGRSLIGLALGWLYANRLVTAPVVGPRTVEQMQTYLDVRKTPWGAEDEALVDGLVPSGHPSTPGYSDPAYPIEGRATGFGPA